MSRILHTALLLALLMVPACSERATEELPPETPPLFVPPEPRPPPLVPPPDLPLPEAFQRSLSAAPAETRAKILTTCKRWMRLDGSCAANATRRDQIRCWWKRGKRELKYTQDLGSERRRSIDDRIMLLQDLCLEMHGWQRRDRCAGV